MTQNTARCLILACGNTLRSDDGVGPWLAEWAEKRFASEADVHVVSRHQWTPELAEEIAHAESVLFIDCSVDSASGSVALTQSSRPLQSKVWPPIIRARPNSSHWPANFTLPCPAMLCC